MISKKLSINIFTCIALWLGSAFVFGNTQDDDLAKFPQKITSDLSSVEINLDTEFVSAREERFGIMSLGVSIFLLGVLQHMDQLGLDDGRGCAICTLRLFGGLLFVNGLFWYTWGVLSGFKKANPLFKGSYGLNVKNLRGNLDHSLNAS